MAEDDSISELRAAARELQSAVSLVRDLRGTWQMPPPSQTLPASSETWNFPTFEKYINQRFTDLGLQLRERYEAQQTGVTAALAAAEKAVNAALIAAEKAVDKAEGAQQLRNEAQNEFRQSLSDLSNLMWTSKEGTSTVESLRRELSLSVKTVDDKVEQLGSTRIKATDDLRQSVERRLGSLETGNANMQGRIWAISASLSAGFAILTLAAVLGFRLVGSSPVQPVTSYVPAPTTPASNAPAPIVAPR